MKPDFSPALMAAQAAAATQTWPRAALYMIATPIGNLADISLRALCILQLADQIACEDTRHTQGMLSIYGIKKPLIALHQHNEAEQSAQVIEHLQNGQRIAYVSDAGTPAVSDPGARLCAAAQSAGLRVIPIPGASSITALLSCAGAVYEAGSFVFEGFLPSKSQERKRRIEAFKKEARPIALLEAPHRILDVAHDLAMLSLRKISLGRELTKQFEEIVTLPCQALSAWLELDKNRSQGEFVLLLHSVEIDSEQSNNGRRILTLLLHELPTKTAVKLASEISGEPRNALYDLALQIKASES